MTRGRLGLVLGLVLGMLNGLAGQPGSAHAATLVPDGNRHAEQPAVPGASSRRTAGARTSFDAKYERIRALLESDAPLQDKIRKIARQYGIAPIHMAGALVGEHTYNVDVYDRLQAYYVKAVSYAGERFRFAHKDEAIGDFVDRPEFSECADAQGSYALWTCREQVWDTVFRGRRVDGQPYPDDRFSAVFFQPFFAGQTFGLGQINPLTALKLSDRVQRVSGYPALSEDDPAGVYNAIMDPDMSLAYMAAILANAIEAYERIAGFDISRNPGLTATLYNVGDAEMRAQQLAARNRGGAKTLPQENYYGWLVNERIADLKAIFPD